MHLVVKINYSIEPSPEEFRLILGALEGRLIDPRDIAEAKALAAQINAQRESFLTTAANKVRETRASKEGQ